MFAIIDNPTIVERPNRGPFLGVTYRLREGVIVSSRATEASRTADLRRRSSCARAESVWTSLVHPEDTGSLGQL